MSHDFANRHCESPGVRARANVPSHRREPGTSNKESILTGIGGETDVSIVEVETAALRRARQRRTGRFLKGPVPISDIAAAARLVGKALPVFLAIRHRTDLTRKNDVTLPAGLMRELGVSKDAKARALRQLEAIGLIIVERERGRSPIITLKEKCREQ